MLHPNARIRSLLLLAAVASALSAIAAQPAVTLEALLAAPFPSEIVAAPQRRARGVGAERAAVRATSGSRRRPISPAAADGLYAATMARTSRR